METFQADECYKFCIITQRSPMGFEGTIFPDLLLKSHSFKKSPYEDNTQRPYKGNLCLFRALALHLHGKNRLMEETSEIFNLFLGKTGGTNLVNFRGVFMEDVAAVEDIVQRDIFYTTLTL